MREPFRDRDGNCLDWAQYSFSLSSQPAIFLGYHDAMEGDSAIPQAVFQDFKGGRHYLTKRQVAVLVSKLAPKSENSDTNEEILEELFGPSA
ncbi:MAG TPA: hypothetical protein VMC80_03810 [Patescibacteria group bacterium]|nr:hypothetical protein [Patescibacteria group bacterium]